MRALRILRKGLCSGLLLNLALASSAFAQKAFTWQEIRGKFEALNPTLRAGLIGIDESKAQEITAFLRPNPDFTLTTDGTQVTRNKGVWRPLAGTYETPSISYLHERRHKRELRLESAQKATGIAVSGQADLERNLLFNVRSAFVGTLQAKTVLKVAKDNLTYWDQVLKVSKDRYD